MACFAGTMVCPGCDGSGRRPATPEETSRALAELATEMDRLLRRWSQIGNAWAAALRGVR